MARGWWFVISSADVDLRRAPETVRAGHDGVGVRATPDLLAIEPDEQPHVDPVPDHHLIGITHTYLEHLGPDDVRRIGRGVADRIGVIGTDLLGRLEPPDRCVFEAGEVRGRVVDIGPIVRGGFRVGDGRIRTPSERIPTSTVVVPHRHRTARQAIRPNPSRPRRRRAPRRS